MIMRALILICACLAGAAAQQVVAPTPADVGPRRGENAGDYNVVNSFEFGYRFSLVGGDLGKYRSDVNYRNGVRLLASNLTVNSRDGRGRFFDEIVLTTLGLGNDPYQSAALRLQKNRVYRYDLLWRLNEFYNPGLTIAAGQHLTDTRRRWQDHDLSLFPQSKLRLRAGYSRNSQSGPALSSIQLFDDRGDEFPLFANVRREYNEYRVGGDLELLHFKLTVLRRWEFFKEDTPLRIDSTLPGNNPNDLTTLNQFHRAEPNHGETPSWLVNLYTGHRYVAVNGRFTYSGGRRNFIQDESAFGITRFGAADNRQTIVFGDARRPVATGDLAVSVLATDRLTIVNNTSFHNTRIDGNSAFQQFDNATQTRQLISFNFLGIRLITNSTDAQLHLTRSLGVFAGYHYSTRLIRSIEFVQIPLASQTNHLHSGVAGVNWNPIKPLRLHLEGEVGRNDQPFTPIAERNYHALAARVQYRVSKLRLSTGYHQRYNNNSITLTAFSSRARNYFADASWSPREWFSIDASYSRLHLDTLGGIAFFAGFGRAQLIQNRQSLYLSNIHSAHLGARFALRKRADLYLGFSLTRDTGDGRATPSQSTDPIHNVLSSVQTFPLSFGTPLARLSIRLNEKLRWNAGYQFYRYHEDFHIFNFDQDYRAHTGYTSLLWSF